MSHTLILYVLAERLYMEACDSKADTEDALLDVLDVLWARLSDEDIQRVHARKTKDSLDAMYAEALVESEKRRKHDR